DQIRNKLSLNIESLGERRFKNIPQPVRTFTIAGSEDDRLFVPARKKSSLSPALLAQSVSAALSRLSVPSISRVLLINSGVAVLALLALAGGYWAYSAYQGSPTRQSNTLAKPTAAPLNVTVLDIQSVALLADAQRLHRPQEEIDSLTGSNTQIAALASQLPGLGTKPTDRTKVRSLLVQMKNLAVDMSHGEATALQHASAQLWRDLEKPPGKTIAPDAAAAIAKAQQAKTDLDNAIAAAQQAQ